MSNKPSDAVSGNEVLVRLRDKSQLTLPRVARRHLNVREGDYLLCEELPNGSIRLVPARLMKQVRRAPAGKIWREEMEEARQEIASGTPTAYASVRDMLRDTGIASRTDSIPDHGPFAPNLEDVHP